MATFVLFVLSILMPLLVCALVPPPMGSVRSITSLCRSSLSLIQWHKHRPVCRDQQSLTSRDHSESGLLIALGSFVYFCLFLDFFLHICAFFFAFSLLHLLVNYLLFPLCFCHCLASASVWPPLPLLSTTSCLWSPRAPQIWGRLPLDKTLHR